ncbi:hypothetical protein HI914_03200 [Erysiphe necator]|nr:hypothetical protein HI914_03200 [Erysiphe necator]
MFPRKHKRILWIIIKPYPNLLAANYPSLLVLLVAYQVAFGSFGDFLVCILAKEGLECHISLYREIFLPVLLGLHWGFVFAQSYTTLIITINK